MQLFFLQASPVIVIPSAEKDVPDRRVAFPAANKKPAEVPDDQAAQLIADKVAVPWDARPKATEKAAK